MDPQRYARVKEVFREAMRWAPEERAAAVAELAGDDAALRDEVLSLLAHHDDAPLIREPAQNIGRLAGAPVAEEGAPARSGEPAPRETAASTAAPREAPGGDDAVVVEGRTLAELLRSERGAGGAAAAGWPLERVIRTLDPIARELASAADRGGVHGAIRADHVVLAEAGAGLDGELGARLVGLDAGGAGPRGAHVAAKIEGAGAASAAPEQLLPALGPIGPWTDVYALALLCVELMLGRPATEGSATAALARTRDEAVQPTPRAVGLEVPAAVEAVMAMALAMRPMERYQDVRRFWTALRASLAASRPPAPASASASALRSSPSASSSRVLMAQASASRLPVRRYRARAARAAGGLVLVLAAVAAVAASRCG